MVDERSAYLLLVLSFVPRLFPRFEIETALLVSLVPFAPAANFTSQHSARIYDPFLRDIQKILTS